MPPTRFPSALIALAATALLSVAAPPAARPAQAQGWGVGPERAAQSASRPRFLTRAESGGAPLRGFISVRVGGLAPQQAGVVVAVRVLAARPGAPEARTPVANTVLSGLPGTFAWDTTEAANGWYEMEVVLIDTDAEREVVTDRMRFEVNNGFQSRVRPAATAADRTQAAPLPEPVAPAPGGGEPETPAPAADDLPRFSRETPVTSRETRRGSSTVRSTPATVPAPPSEAAFAGSKNAPLLRTALGYRGAPYRFGASGRDGVFDCSSYTQTIFRRWGISLPRTAAAQFGRGTAVAKSALKPGDLVFFKNTYKAGVSHVGIYLGGGHFIHAANSKQGVRVDRLEGGYYAEHWAGARRVR